VGGTWESGGSAPAGAKSELPAPPTRAAVMSLLTVVLGTVVVGKKINEEGLASLEIDATDAAAAPGRSRVKLTPEGAEGGAGGAAAASEGEAGERED